MRRRASKKCQRKRVIQDQRERKEMSQQEFYPEQSYGQPPGDDEIYYPPQPYNWSTRPNTEGMAKEGSLPDDGESMMQRGYRAQNGASHTQGSATKVGSQQAQPRRGSPAGWIILFIVLVLMFIGPLFSIVFSFIGITLAVIGMVIFALLIPFLLVFLIGLPYLLFRVLTGRPFPQRRWRYTNYWRSNNYWRGPWRW